MKINYIAYLDPFEYKGGGEINLRGVIERGRRRGHEIRITSAYKIRKTNLFSNPDLFILADIYNSPLTRRRLDENLITQIVKKEKYIHFDNAYSEVCHRDYIPCNGKVNGEFCWFVKGRFDFRRGFLRGIIDCRDEKFRSKKCFSFHNLLLYKNSLLNVFVSPLHQHIISGFFGNEIIGNYFNLKQRIDSKVFYNRYTERDIDNLFVGVISEAKGWYEMRRRFLGTGNITFVGSAARGIKIDFGYHIPYIPNEEIPLWMNRAKNFVFLPRWPEPAGRVVVEAALCGCNLILNENVGIMSFGSDLRDPKNFENPEEELWDKIESIIP